MCHLAVLEGHLVAPHNGKAWAKIESECALIEWIRSQPRPNFIWLAEYRGDLRFMHSLFDLPPFLIGHVEVVRIDRHIADDNYCEDRKWDIKPLNPSPVSRRNDILALHL